MNELAPIQRKIYEIRGQKVILDRDLAALYQVETRVLNQAVKRNIERFPEDFMFQLTKEEVEILKSQIVTSSDTEFLKSQIVILEMGEHKSSQNAITSDENLKSQNAISNEEVLRSQFVTLEKEDMRGKHVKFLPYAFTENGIAMLSGVLRSPMAIATNIHIMRAFNAMRHFIGSHAQVFQRIENIEKNVLALNAHTVDTDKKIEEVFRRLDQGEAVPKEMVFFKGEFFVARVIFEKIVKTATKRVIIIDEYIDAATFEMLDVRAKGVTADIYSNGLHATLRDAHNTTTGLEPIQTHKWRNASHDRWIIADDTLYHCGHSLKDTGNKLSCIDVITSISADVVLNYVR